MKIVKLILSLLLICSTLQMTAQEMKNTSGRMDATTMNTFNYEKDGVKYPYQVTIREQRAYEPRFTVNEDKQSIQEQVSTPAVVAKLITITNKRNDFDNIVISLKYEKQLTDTFELVSSPKGFAVVVDGKTMEYIMGEGIYFANTPDKDFFVVDVFDRFK